MHNTTHRSSILEEFANMRKDAASTNAKTTDPRKVTFTECVAKCDLRETDAEKLGICAVNLLMKGKFVTSLTKLLEENDTPVPVKLVICDFLLAEGFSDSYETVEKTLVEVCHNGRKEWQSNTKKQQQQQQSTDI